MAAAGLGIVVVLGFVLLVTVGLVLAFWYAANQDTTVATQVTAARRHAAVTHIAAWTLAVGGVPALGVVSMEAPWLTAMLVPVGAGLLFVGACWIGEMTWPAPGGSVRRAALTRRVTPVPTRLLLGAGGAWSAGLLAVHLALAAVTTDGYVFVRSTPTRGRAVGPFPGWDEGLPVLVGAALLIVAVAATMRAVSRRPAVAGEPDFDGWSRRVATHRVLRGAQLGLGVTLSLVIGSVALVLRAADLPAGNAVSLAAFAVLIVAVAVAAVPAGRSPVTTPATSVTAAQVPAPAQDTRP